MYHQYSNTSLGVNIHLRKKSRSGFQLFVKNKTKVTAAMSGQETARAQEATGELNIWTHLSNSESGPTCEPSLRGQKFRSVALSGDRIAAITDANNGSISWFPKYRGWSSASSLPQKEGKESFENKTETEGKAGNNIEEPQQDTPRN